MIEIKNNLEDIALRVVTLEPEDIPALGEILNLLTKLEHQAGKKEFDVFMDITRGLKSYLEKFIFGEESNIEPVDEGITILQEMCRVYDQGLDYEEDISELLRQLKGAAEAENDHNKSPESTPATEPTDDTHEAHVAETGAAADADDSQPVNLSSEDIQIISDFIGESRENLDSIELNIVELEQAPGDLDIINSIFRPFHTIKGVSGFLNLQSVNRLAHTTENLLDSARQGEFAIDDAVTDIILESVDTLKNLIANVEENLSANTGPLEGHIDVDELIRRIENLNKNQERPLGEILVEKGVVNGRDVEEALEQQKKDSGKKIGEMLLKGKKVPAREVVSGLREQKRGKKVSSLQVKVDTQKLDNLVDLTGELVISQSMLKQNTGLLSQGDQKLYQNLNQLAHIVSSIQKIAMSMRMVPIKSTFQKMVRLVRDLARNSGKEIGLEMSGEDTEIDRNMVDALYEPMVHMIRNSADHGIGTIEERQKAGKNPKGMIHLRAYHKGGNIVIEIEDDGRGLNKEKILKKALASELISQDANLPDDEIYELIMHPGFSTAQKITDVSGRGVGMDVVKKGIETLRGRLEIRSKPGEGTMFVITLPLTLAIIEGMLVRVGKDRFVIPTMAILESLKPSEDKYFTVEGKGEMVMIRGNLIPLIRLDQIFGVEGDARMPWEGLVVVVENKDERCALLLDDLLGKGEFVIKSLGESLKGIKGVAGGAILGDGQVGLILDIAGLFDHTFKHTA
jgi:two-component system chemotaxis sensor kinase CheA